MRLKLQALEIDLSLKLVSIIPRNDSVIGIANENYLARGEPSPFQYQSFPHYPQETLTLFLTHF